MSVELLMGIPIFFFTIVSLILSHFLQILQAVTHNPDAEYSVYTTDNRPKNAQRRYTDDAGNISKQKHKHVAKCLSVAVLRVTSEIA